MIISIATINSSCSKTTYCARCTEITTGASSADFCNEDEGEVEFYISELKRLGMQFGFTYNCSIYTR
ncbi:MAG: hypothetical protein HOP11_15485 [Saprospiraceae bacterium]|nr:hypothetical protein [Saprospiraceae bacterium]